MPRGVLKPGDSRTLTAAASSEPQPGLRALLYLVMEYRRPRAAGARFVLDEVDEIRLGRGVSRAGERTAERMLRIDVADPRMSSEHARLARLGNRWALEDLGSKNGTRVNGKRVPRALLGDGDRIELGETLFCFREVAVDEACADLETPASIAPGLATLSPRLARELERLAAIARAEVPVLVMGESGSGKELVARAVHALSQRRGRFVAVNCGALPEALVEASLFGHRRGAFSGAVDDRPGLVRAADRGTLLLDEIGDLPAPSQAALLRVLQEKEVTAVGDTEPTKVDVRFVAATHRDLRALAHEDRFRADLLARLEGFKLLLPPLRERLEDLGVVVAALLDRLAPSRQVAFHPDAARALAEHDWPANVRELEQALSAALALSGDGDILLEHLPLSLGAARADVPGSKRQPAPLSPEDTALRDRLIALLEEHRGNVTAVARALDKDRTQVRRWLGRFGLEPEHFR